MWHIDKSQAAGRCASRSGTSRRDLLRYGVLSAAGGWSLAELLRAEALADKESIPPIGRARGKSVILLWMDGGPSQHDTFDPTPDAPAEIRGEFAAISSAVPGVAICEGLPRTARLTDRFAIVRSLRHTDGLHEGAIHWVQTGHGYPGEFNPVDRRHPRNPSLGSVVAFEDDRAGLARSGLSYVKIFKDGGYGHTYQGPVFLGPKHEPLSVGGDIRGTAFHEPDPFHARHLQAPALELPTGMTLDRLDDRRRMLSALDDAARRFDGAGASSVDAHRRQAFELLRSGATRTAFDLSRESAETRERYGRHLWGQGTLLARRLVEAGVRFVTVNLHGDPPIPSPFSWDTHVAHFPAMRDHLLPVFDRLFSALVEDLADRGLDENVLVVAVGEFGRTPKVFSDGRPGGPGRSHWPNAFSAALFGGGVRGGLVLGSTDAHGAEVKDRPFSPADLLATICRHLGVDHAGPLPGEAGRPTPKLPDADPIDDLFA